MRIKAKGLLFLLLIIICQGKCLADEIALRKEKSANLLIHLSLVLAQEPSLYIKATEAIHVDAASKDSAGNEYTGKYLLHYKGDEFLHKIEIVGKQGPTYSKTEAYDGHYYQAFDQGAGLLMVSVRQFQNALVMSEGHFLHMPFIFCESAFKNNALAQLSYVQLDNQDDFKSIASSILQGEASLEKEPDQQTLLKVVNIGSCLDLLSGQAASFDVYFNSDGYPVKWMKHLQNGEIVSTYSVTTLDNIKLGNQVSLPYPKKALLTHYQKGQVINSAAIEINEIRFGTVDGNDLTIDPANAKTIRDLDRKVYLPVPK